ncbi:hypothetical protein MRSR164_05185 [Methylobacterium radiotolerans]|uniref:Uncharacterized protein n=1 Tax=Methylobacterium radiotolerans TaxID=31998 RepID=A0ABU7T6M2_9HYPH
MRSGRAGQARVEHRGDDPDEGAGGRGSRDLSADPARQPLAAEGVDAREFGLEHRRAHRVPGADRVEIDPQVARQALDHVAAQAVLGGEGEAARGRHLTHLDHPGIGRDRSNVPGVALRRGRDRRGTEADERRRRIGGVAGQPEAVVAGEEIGVHGAQPDAIPALGP